MFSIWLHTPVIYAPLLKRAGLTDSGAPKSGRGP